MKKLKAIIKNRFGEKKVANIKKGLNIARIVKNIVCWTLIAVLTVAIVVFLFTKNQGGSPSFFGYRIYRIESGSMEPDLSVGDIIVSKSIKDINEVNIGDIVTFQGNADYDYQKVTHRVLVAPYDDGKGNMILVTKGDANEVDDGEIKAEALESKCISKVSFLKDLYAFFFSRWGLIVFVLLLLFIFIDEILNIFRVMTNRDEQEDNESLFAVYERLKMEEKEKPKDSNASDESSKENVQKDNTVLDDTSAERTLPFDSTEKSEGLDQVDPRMQLSSKQKRSHNKTADSGNKTNQNKQKKSNKQSGKNTGKSTAGKPGAQRKKKKSKKRKKR